MSFSCALAKVAVVLGVFGLFVMAEDHYVFDHRSRSVPDLTSALLVGALLFALLTLVAFASRNLEFKNPLAMILGGMAAGAVIVSIGALSVTVNTMALQPGYSQFADHVVIFIGALIFKAPTVMVISASLET